jgi:hypothetical protein
MKTTLKKTRLKITEAVRSARLKLVEEALVPSVTFDTDVPGFALHVTTRKAFWGVTYQPRGINPATGSAGAEARGMRSVTPTRCRSQTPARPPGPLRRTSAGA